MDYPKSTPSRSRRKASQGFYTKFPLLLLAVLGSVKVADAQGGTVKYDPRTQVCSLNFHRSTIVGTTLYVDGGELLPAKNYVNGTDKLLNNNKVIRWQNEHLWKLDLSKSFPVNRPPWDPETKPESFEEHYNGAQSTLWNLGDGKFTTVGGWFTTTYGPDARPYGLPIIRDGKYYKLPQPRMFTYDTTTRSWSNVLLDKTVRRISAIGWTQSVRNKLGFTVGGININEEAELAPNTLPAPVTTDWLDTMTVYDFRNQTWKTDPLPREVGRVSDVHLYSLDRVGNDGVLVFFGGVSKDSKNIITNRGHDKVHVYDLDSKTWYVQTATGDIPSPRKRACSVLVPAPDLSSYQIYYFAGSLGTGRTEEETRILDMHVLSVPSFTWKKIELDGYPDNLGIGDHACSVFNSRQMIIVPGERNASDTAGQYMHRCDPHLEVRIFDTYEWKFKDTFDPELKDNLVPQGIVNIIGGSSTGKPTLNQPRAGFDDKALQDAFGKRNSEIKFPDDIPTGGSSNPSNTSTGGSPGPTGDDAEGKDDKKTNIGAIAGGVVGGIAGAALLCSVAFIMCHRRKKKSSNIPPQAELAGYPAAAEVSGGYEGNWAATDRGGMAKYYDQPPPQELMTESAHEMGVHATGYYAPTKVEGSVEESRELLKPPETPPSNPASPALSDVTRPASSVSPISPQTPFTAAPSGGSRPIVMRKAVGGAI